MLDMSRHIVCLLTGTRATCCFKVCCQKSSSRSNKEESLHVGYFICFLRESFLEFTCVALVLAYEYGRHLYVLALASSQQTNYGQIATFDHIRQCQFISLHWLGI